MKRKTPTSPKESDICKHFVNHFKTLQIYNQISADIRVYHIANESMSGVNYINHLIAMGMKPGIADYLVEYDGNRHAWIEFKRDAKSKQTKNQKLFQQDCISRNVPYFLTHDVNQAIEFIKSL